MQDEAAEVWVVDDDGDARTAVRALLELDGHRVVDLDGGAAAISRLVERRPDLMLLDMCMPGVDGLAVTRWTREHVRRFVPILLLTALDDEKLLAEAIDTGADEVLRKPVASTELRLRVRALLRIARLTSELLTAKRSLLQLALTDELTGVTNLRGFRSAMRRELHRISRRGGDLTMLLFDVDHFKRVNDEHGHPVGDAVLREIAAALSLSAREMDLVARVGGEEFAVLAPDAGPQDAVALGERLRLACAQRATKLDDGRALQVTVSCGVASFSQFSGCTSEVLIAAADRALYTAKSTGRNRTERARRLRPHEPTLSLTAPAMIEPGVMREIIDEDPSVIRVLPREPGARQPPRRP